jgi:hypothetical protein
VNRIRGRSVIHDIGQLAGEHDEPLGLRPPVNRAG